MKNMKKKWYEDIEELCEDIVDIYESLENDLPTVSVIAKFDEAREVIAGLCKLDYKICNISIEDPEFVGYKDEYLIGLTNDEVYCTKLKKEKNYIECNSDYVFILDNCNSKLLKRVCVEYEIYEASLNDNDDFDFVFEDDDEECEVSVDFEEDLHGFTVNRNSDDGYSSLSFYSTEKLCACEMQHLLDIFRL